jgi:hypothetical protein
MAEFDDIKTVLDGFLSGLRNQTLLNKIGLAGIRLIKKRTREGIFLEGSSPGHTTYSEGHKKKREKAGLPTSIVNLQFDDIDGMLTEVDHVILNSFEGVAIDIMDEEKREIGYYHNVSGAGKSRIKRVWFDLDDAERQQIVDLVEGEASDLINRLVAKLDND